MAQTPTPPKNKHFLELNFPKADYPLTSSYSSARPSTMTNPQPLLPLKNFQEYFGRIKPSLAKQLKSIFQRTSLQQQLTQKDYGVTGKSLPTHRSIRTPRSSLSPPNDNNFTIESMKPHSFGSKSKLKKILMCREVSLERALGTERASQIMEQNARLSRQLRAATFKQRPPRVNRSFGSSMQAEKRTVIDYIRRRYTQYSLSCLHLSVQLIHELSIQVSPNIGYFTVFVQEGNNCELVKALVRKRTGWRIVEIPAIANFIWTQGYRKALLQKRLRKKGKGQLRDINPPKSSRGPSTEEKGADTEKQGSFGIQLSRLYGVGEGQVRKLKMSRLKQVQVGPNLLMHNHFPNNNCISDKKNLLLNLTSYLEEVNEDVFQVVPQSYELTDLENPCMEELPESTARWIIKPGENSNRGRGIVVCHSGQQAMEELRKRLQEPAQGGEGGEEMVSSCASSRRRSSYILQRYVMPLLYQGRKFDIRSYLLVTLLNGQVRGYCYQECYMRTASRQFEAGSLSRYVHLTNDAIQAQAPDYGKYEEGNKLSEALGGRHIDQEGKKIGRNNAWNEIKIKMQERCTQILESSWQQLVEDCHNSQDQDKFYFELFGLDFMVDAQLKLWLIEVNTNPSITSDCSRLLSRLIPRMLDNVLSVAVEPLMRPHRVPQGPYNSQFYCVFNKRIN